MSIQTPLPVARPPAMPQPSDQPTKPAFIEPKLTWIEPQLTPQGTLTAVAQSGGFFGSFSP